MVLNLKKKKKTYYVIIFEVDISFDLSCWQSNELKNYNSLLFSQFCFQYILYKVGNASNHAHKCWEIKFCNVLYNVLEFDIEILNILWSGFLY